MPPRKRARSASTEDLHLFPIYENLANVDEGIRIKATHDLLDEVVRNRGDDDQRWNEVLHTLVKGLCSSQKVARIGYSVALTELLSMSINDPYDSVHSSAVPDILSIVKLQKAVRGSLSRQEDRDHDLALILGAEAIARSGALLQGNSVTFNRQIWRNIVDFALTLASHKPWIREECGFMLYALINSMLLPQDDLQCVTSIAVGFQTHNLYYTPEGIAIWIALALCYPRVPLPKGLWSGDGPLSKGNEKRLARVLHDALSNPTSPSETEHSKRPLERKAALHYSWQVILSNLFKSHKVDSTNEFPCRIPLDFERFWKSCVDDTCFSSKASSRTQCQGFLIVDYCIVESPPQLITYFISKNFLHCLTSQFESKNQVLQKAAEKVRKAIHDRCRRDPNASIPVVAAFLSPSDGVIDFDRRTKTKTIALLLSDTARIHPHELVSLFDRLLVSFSARNAAHSHVQQQVLTNYLVAVIRSFHRDCIEEEPCNHFVRVVLSMLAKFAYFNVQSSSPDGRFEPVSETSRLMYRTRISSCLTHITSQCTRPADFVSAIVEDIRRHEKSHKVHTPLLCADSKIQKLMNESFSRLLSLKREITASSERAKVLNPLNLLLSLSVLQVYNGDLDSIGLLEDLVPMINIRETTRDSIHSSEVVSIIEILLSLLSKPSQLFRRIACQVFRSMTDVLEPVSLQPIYKILSSKENLTGQAEVFDRHDEEEIGSETASMLTSASAQGSSSEDSVSQDMGSSTADHDSANEEQLAIFDNQLAQALGTKVGTSLPDGTDGSSLDSDLDDEQMEKLDQHLESIFRERQKVKKPKVERQDAQVMMVNFKCRVLDLLDIFVKQERQNLLVFDLIMPILSLIRSTSSPTVSQRCCDIIRLLAGSWKGETSSYSEIMDDLPSVIHQIHQEVGKRASNVHTKACSRASLFLVRILVACDRDQLRHMVELYAQTQEKALFDPDFDVKPSFFAEWWDWCYSAKKNNTF